MRRGGGREGGGWTDSACQQYRESRARVVMMLSSDYCQSESSQGCPVLNLIENSQVEYSSELFPLTNQRPPR